MLSIRVFFLLDNILFLLSIKKQKQNKKINILFFPFSKKFIISHKKNRKINNLKSKSKLF